MSDSKLMPALPTTMACSGLLNLTDSPAANPIAKALIPKKRLNPKAEKP